MVINDEVKSVVEGSPFISIVTMGADNAPHPIIVGGGKVAGDEIAFGIYKMEVTQKNIAVDQRAWVTAAIMDGAPKGFRLTGTARAEDKQLIFHAECAEGMI